MRELLVGTRKGLFVLHGEDAREYEVAARAFAGDVVEYAMRDPRTGRYLASVTSGFYGPRVMYTDDPNGEWQQVVGPGFPEDSDDALVRIWALKAGERDGQVWAGSDPAALWESSDGGITWELNRGLWDQPTRPDWSPGGGGLALHSIWPWPGDPDRITVGISAVGVWHSDDGGTTWRHGNEGLVPGYLPEDAHGETIDLCIHNMHRAPLRPERLFMQFHGGVYRSDDAGESWIDIGEGLPSDFGFPIVGDPGDPDSAFVIPMTGAEDRTVPGGHLRVHETRDAGKSWTPLGEGLPVDDAYVTILRQAFDKDGGDDDLGLFFGATSGEVFGSHDAGRTWFTAAQRLAPVTSVRVAPTAS
jgi:photosystem II stability/assembly factor-like uncharacterized protein